MKFTSEMMKKVHRIAKEMEGHFYCRLSLAFHIVMKEEKEMTKETLVQATLKHWINLINSIEDTRVTAERKEEATKAFEARMNDKEVQTFSSFEGIVRARTISKLTEMLAKEEAEGIYIKVAGEDLNTEITLPKLEGSEKQIAWANQIKAERLAKMNELLEKAKSNTKVTEQQKEYVIVKLSRNIIALANEKSAKTIIDTRCAKAYEGVYEFEFAAFR